MNRTLWAIALAVVAGSTASAAPDFKSFLESRFPSKYDTVNPNPKIWRIPGQIRLKLKPSALTALRQAGTGKSRLTGATIPLPASATLRQDLKIDGWTVWNVDPSTDTKALAKSITGKGDVLVAEPVNLVRMMIPDPNDADYNYMEDINGENFLIIDDTNPPEPFSRTWNLDGTAAMLGWSTYPNTWYTAATKPRDVPTISVIDSGCDLAHPDFMNAGGATTSVTGGGQLLLNYSNRFQAGIQDPNLSAQDDNGHGTHVTGLALAAGNNGDSYDGHGMVGIGYNCQGMINAIIDSTGNGTDTDAALAIYYAVDHGADVINCSFGGTEFSILLQGAVTYAIERGVTVVCAGNESNAPTALMPPLYPAGCAGAVAVQAISGTGGIATSYVGGGLYLDVAAPGGDIYTDTGSTLFFNWAALIFIWSTTPTSDFAILHNGSVFPPAKLGYSYLIGTSMACPQVSGAAGLWMSQGRRFWGSGYTPQAFGRALNLSSALGTSTSGTWDGAVGFGLLDCDALMRNVANHSTTGASLEGQVYTNGIATSANVKAQRVGVTTSTTITTDTHGHYRFETLQPGTYNITYQTLVGATKVKKVVLVGGTETQHVNGWAWSAGVDTTQFDTTAPVIGRFELAATPTASGMTLRQWAFDTETGIDKIQVRVGTTLGGNDVMADTEYVVDGDTISVNVPMSSATRYVRLTATNGAGVTTTQDLPVYGTNPMRTITLTSTLGNWLNDAGGFLAECRIRDNATNAIISTFKCPTRRIGENQFTTNAPGVLKVGTRMAHWIRSFGTTGASGNAIVNLSLTNGDVSGDGSINLVDFSQLSTAYGSQPHKANWNEMADLNGDGRVNLTDFSILSSNYGKTEQ